jgi:hypothetical protein
VISACRTLGDNAMELQPFYYWTVWWTPLAVFVLALVVCHVVLVYSRWQLSKENWKRVDYIWLTMTFISIIGLVSQSRQMLSTTYIPFAANQVRFHQQDIDRDLTDSAHLNCDFRFTKTPNSPPDFDESIQQMGEYCAQLRSLQRTLGPSLTARQKIDYDVSRDTEYPLAYDFSNQRARLKSDVESFNRNIEILQDLQKATGRSEAEQILVLFAPFLIALALALRITKVTADLRS